MSLSLSLSLSLSDLLSVGAGSARELFAVACVFSLLLEVLKSKSVSAWRPSHFFLFAQKEVTKKEGTPRPRRPRIRRARFPAVLAGSRPLRNSHVPVLEHARFPLDPAPLLGAPEGPRVPSTRLPAWSSRRAS
ncbi:MAG: hypothetical protein IPK27_13045 [Rhodanobacteraceae bacterium]|nr:hypothetical protein [Rhodanobacteraceae bacterium]